MARIQLKIWRAPLATLQASLAEGEVGISTETNTFYKRPDGNGAGALIPVGGGAGVSTMRARASTTGNVTLSGAQTIDGVALVAGDLVLVNNQTTSSQNGLYAVAAGSWARASGADSWTLLVNAIYVVEQGTANADTIWMCTSDSGGTLNTTALTFQAVNNRTGATLSSVTPAADALPYFTGPNTATTTTLTAAARTLLDDTSTAAMLTTLGAQPADAELTAVAGLATNGIIVKTAAGAAATRSIAVSGTGLSVTNADGIAGNPTITSNATELDTASTLVMRNAAGSFRANIVIASLQGNADTATKLATARTLSVSGDATGSASFDGTANSNIALTLPTTGVTAGSYSNVTVDAKGRVTAGTNAGGTMSGAAITGSTVNSTAIGATTPSTGAFTTLSASGNASVTGTLTTNNLIVNGTTTTINSTTMTLDDPVITLGGDTAPTVDDNKDRGVEFRWHNGTAAKVGYFGFDDSTGKFVFIPDATNTAEVFSGATGVLLANTEGTHTGSVVATTMSASSTVNLSALTASSSLSLDASKNIVSVANTGSGNNVLAVSPTFTGVPAAPTAAAGTDTTQIATTAFVKAAVVASAGGDAVKLATARSISITGDGTWTTSFDGSANVTGALTLANSGVTAGSYGAVTVDAKGRVIGGSSPTTLAGHGITDAQPLDAELTAVAGLATNGIIVKTAAGAAATRSIAVSGTGLSVTNADGIAGNPTITSNATSINTGSTLVLRDSNGDFSARIVNATTLNGNAATATKLATARTLTATGDASWSVSFDGSANVTNSLTLATTGITAGTYRSLTVDDKGRATAGTNPTTLSGYGITDAAPIASPTFTGTATLAGVQEARTVVSASNIDLATGTYFTRTISGATTLTVSNVAAAGKVSSFVLDLVNGGSAVITWWANVKWAKGAAPALTTAGRDALGFFTHDAGATWTGLVLGKDIK